MVPPDRSEGGPAEADALVHRFFGQFLSEDAASASRSEAGPDVVPTPRRREFDAACTLLDRASRALEALAARCRHLERDLDAADERGRAQAAAQDEAVERWRRLASALKAQAAASDQAAALLRARCEAAEARAAALEKDAVRAVIETAAAEQLSTTLRDRVAAAFGAGSRAYPVIEAVAPPEAAGG